MQEYCFAFVKWLTFIGEVCSINQQTNIADIMLTYLLFSREDNFYT